MEPINLKLNLNELMMKNRIQFNKTEIQKTFKNNFLSTVSKNCEMGEERPLMGTQMLYFGKNEK